MEVYNIFCHRTFFLICDGNTIMWSRDATSVSDRGMCPLNYLISYTLITTRGVADLPSHRHVDQLPRGLVMAWLLELPEWCFYSMTIGFRHWQTGK